MLYIGEKVGHGPRAARAAAAGAFPQVDIAVDPLEGTNLCATGAPNAIAVLAASTSGGLLHAPDLYMEKLVVGPSSKDHVSLDAPVHENLRAIARLSRPVGRRPRRHRPRSAAAREADRRHPRDRRPHPADWRRRPVGRHRRGGRRVGRPRGDGHRRRARRRADRRRHALPERRDLRAAGRHQARARGALPRDGHHRLQEESTSRRISRPARR